MSATPIIAPIIHDPLRHQIVLFIPDAIRRKHQTLESHNYMPHITSKRKRPSSPHRGLAAKRKRLSPRKKRIGKSPQKSGKRISSRISRRGQNGTDRLTRQSIQKYANESRKINKMVYFDDEGSFIFGIDQYGNLWNDGQQMTIQYDDDGAVSYRSADKWLPLYGQHYYD